MNTIKIMHPWAQNTEELMKILETSKDGLTDEEVSKRLSFYGNNIFKNKNKLDVINIFLKQFVSPLIFLLIGAAVLTGLLSEWLDMWVIIFVITVNVVLGFYHEYKAENTLAKLGSYIKDRARVIRNGIEQEIDSTEIVPGDIIRLSYGTRIPSDAKIFSINNFKTDESILTGESLPVEKNTDQLSLTSIVSEHTNIAHAGTLVVEGYAHAVVYATGDHTEIGKIAKTVSDAKKTETPLQKSVGKLAWIICSVVIFLVIGIVILGIVRGQPIFEMLILATSVAVGAVPESLPIALTVILAIGSLKLAHNKGVVRKLAATETLGQTTLIMTDKTGTLTQAQMKLVNIESIAIILNDTESNIKEKLNNEQKSLLELATFNIEVVVENPNEDKKNWQLIGRPFEKNIAQTCIANAINTDNLFSKNSAMILPFNSTNKFSVASSGDKYTIMGAPDILLRKSNLSKEECIKIEKWIEKTSNDGKRIIGLATCKKTNSDFKITDIENINFEGVLVFYDPIRPEVPQAIKNIEAHGIKMVLVTGDLLGTALAIAKELDWKVEKNQTLTGYEIREMNDEELLSVISDIKIFARVTPEDKLRIGKLYQKLGEIVAMTGDGVNDAPALKSMDIGISLGTASDVAKAAADLVLLDDNFQTISVAIDEGRHIMSNIRKTFVYLLATSFDELVIIGGALLLSLPLPITPLQIVWVNLFTGSLPALSFAFDEQTKDSRFKIKKAQEIFTPYIKNMTIIVGVSTSLLLFALYNILLATKIDIATAKSIFFVCFTTYTLVIVYSFRNLHQNIFQYKVFSNKKLNMSLLISFSILFITIFVPQIRSIFAISKLPVYSVFIVIIWLIVNVSVVEFIKYIMNRRYFKTTLIGI